MRPEFKQNFEAIALVRNDMARIYDLAEKAGVEMDLELCYDIAVSRCPEALKLTRGEQL